MNTEIQEEQPVSPIEQALVKANVTETVLAELQTLKGLKINGIDDKVGFQEVFKARQRCKNIRGLAVKICKKGREEAIDTQRKWIAKEKDVVSRIEEVEAYLQSEEDKVEAEKEQIKQEAIRKEQERIQARVRVLLELGMSFNGSDYGLGEHSINSEQVRDFTDNQFFTFAAQVEVLANQVKAQEAEYERTRKEEEARMAKVAQDQELERQRLEAERRKIADEQARRDQEIQAEKDKLAAEQKSFYDQRTSARTKQLLGMGLQFNGDGFLFEHPPVYINFHHTDVSGFDDERWNTETTKAFDTIAVYNKYQEQERKKEIKEAEEKAVERARIQEQERLKKAEEDRIERERNAKEDEEFRIASLSDKEKLKKLYTDLSHLMSQVQPYELRTKVAKTLQFKVFGLINEAINLLK